ncbi:MAG: hypothetical protein V4539_10170 [Bacteroidota bacterium]
MKQPMYKTVLSHPFTQLTIFLLIVIGGQVFAAPYGWIIRYAIVTNEFFAIAGIVAIMLVLLSLLMARFVLQLLGLTAMWVSLIAFYAQTNPEARGYMFGTPLTVITLLLFLIVSLIIILKKNPWKNL